MARSDEDEVEAHSRIAQNVEPTDEADEESEVEAHSRRVASPRVDSPRVD
ncbi:MAG TPA: hypothetical protein VJQ85_08865 [Gaiellaceae bacterium]|nr:hypothetical protein [Gaiellaceae bacterium]